MKKLISVTILAMFITFAFSIAQQKGGRGFHGGGKGFMGKLPGYQFYYNNKSDLKLDDAQLKKLKDIDNSFQKEKIDLRSKIQYAALELKEEMNKSKLDKNELLKIQDKIQNLRNAMQKRVLVYKIDLHSVLTDEQKMKIDDIRANCPRKGNGFGSKNHGKGSGREKGQCYNY